MRPSGVVLVAKGRGFMRYTESKHKRLWKRKPCFRPHSPQCREELLHLNLSTGLFQLGFEGIGFVLRTLLFHGLGSTVNQFFGFLEAQTREVFHQLNDGQFVSAGIFEDNVKFSLSSSSRGSISTTCSRTCNGNGCSSGFNTVLVLEDSG